MIMLIAGIVIGAVIGWIVANAWRDTPTGQPRPLVFLAHRRTGETYRLEQAISNVAGLGSRTLILYRVADYSLEAWPEERVDAEFERQPEPPSPEVQRLLDQTRKRAAERV